MAAQSLPQPLPLPLPPPRVVPTPGTSEPSPVANSQVVLNPGTYRVVRSKTVVTVQKGGIGSQGNESSDNSGQMDSEANGKALQENTASKPTGKNAASNPTGKDNVSKAKATDGTPKVKGKAVASNKRKRSVLDNRRGEDGDECGSQYDEESRMILDSDEDSPSEAESMDGGSAPKPKRAKVAGHKQREYEVVGIKDTRWSHVSIFPAFKVSPSNSYLGTGK